MKTDISIPNPIFHSAEKLAQKMGISLSDLYTAALTAYVTEHQKGQVTDTLDRIYAEEPSTVEPELVKMQVSAIGSEQW
jgi:hypothetical protein